MNNDPNSDSEQCTESKLGRVHSPHTHGPGCAQAARALRLGREHSAVSQRALGRVMAHRASYRGRARSCCRPCYARTLLCRKPCRVRTLPCRRPYHARTLQCRRPPGHYTKFVSQHRPLPRAVLQPSCAVSQGLAAPYRSRVTRYVAAQGRPPATIQHLYHDSPASQTTCAHARCSPQCRPVV